MLPPQYATLQTPDHISYIYTELNIFKNILVDLDIYNYFPFGTWHLVQLFFFILFKDNMVIHQKEFQRVCHVFDISIMCLHFLRRIRTVPVSPQNYFFLLEQLLSASWRTVFVSSQPATPSVLIILPSPETDKALHSR